VACSKEEPPPEPVRPVLSIKVQALDEESLGRFAGTIQARYESNIGFRVPGRIASRNVDVGAEVEKGALLATLDPTDQQNQLRSAQGDLARVQAQLINAQSDLTVCGEAGNPSEAFSSLAKVKPELVLSDLTMPGRSGLELIKDLKAAEPNLAVLVVSMHDEVVFAERPLRAGRGGVPVGAWGGGGG